VSALATAGLTPEITQLGFSGSIEGQRTPQIQGRKTSFHDYTGAKPPIWAVMTPNTGAKAQNGVTIQGRTPWDSKYKWRVKT
jgi:hypothetical protein